MEGCDTNTSNSVVSWKDNQDFDQLLPCLECNFGKQNIYVKDTCGGQQVFQEKNKENKNIRNLSVCECACSGNCLKAAINLRPLQPLHHMRNIRQDESS